MFDNIRIVLVNTSHPGNIGSAARAMKTMGLSQLTLVNPKIFPDSQATALAAGAVELLEHCVVASSLTDALADCHFVIATSARERRLPWPSCDPHHAAKIALKESRKGQVAIVFGSERVGLLNEELHLAHRHLIIPANPEYSSLNLAAAVQVICYELRMAFLTETESIVDAPLEEPATLEQTENFYLHLEKILLSIKFLNEKHPIKLMRRLRRLFQRTQLSKMEVNILQGILKAVETMEQKR